MSKHIKDNRNFMLHVDGYRRPSRRRNTAGAYQVGAKNPEEAVEMLRKAIGFGSIKVAYECGDRPLAHGVVKRCVFVGRDKNPRGYEFEDPVHATAPQAGKA